MKEYGKVRSTKQPEQKVIDDYSVWIAENITPVTEAGTDEQPGFTGYEYDLTQYTKDEYIKMIDDRNASLEDQMTQAQEAMCEIYEMMMLQAASADCRLAQSAALLSRFSSPSLAAQRSASCCGESSRRRYFSSCHKSCAS